MRLVLAGVIVVTSGGCRFQTQICLNAPPAVRTKHGMRVYNLTTHPFLRESFEAEVDRTVNAWAPAIAGEHAEFGDHAVHLFGVTVILVNKGRLFYQKKAKGEEIEYEKVGGLASKYVPFQIELAWDGGAFADTGLGNELGHLFQHKCLGEWGNDDLEKLHKRYGVPF
jgi:hypothetical protein